MRFSQRIIIEQAMFVYSPLGKQTEKQVVVIKSPGPSNKLKQIPQDLMNDLIRSKLKGTV